jgi:hypothetical protein
MEEAGINVKVPNWWSVKHPPRPQLDVGYIYIWLLIYQIVKNYIFLA